MIVYFPIAYTVLRLRKSSQPETPKQALKRDQLAPVRQLNCPLDKKLMPHKTPPNMKPSWKGFGLIS